MARPQLSDAQIEERFLKKGRKALPPAEQAGPDFVGATPLDMAEQERTARSVLALAEDNAVTLAQQLGYKGSLEPDALENGARDAIRRINMALFELGGYLRLMRERCGHGDFINRLEKLDLQPRVAQQYMQVARRFSNANSNSHLEALGKTKLLEMLVLDDEQIEELVLTGQTGELALDDVATMSVKELRAALRQAKHDTQFTGEQLQKERQRADSAEKKLAGKRPVVVPLDERILPFKGEIADRQSLIESGIEAHHQATLALEQWWTDEVTQAENYDPTEPVPLPRSVALVALSLQDSLNRLAELVGAAQHAFAERFGDDLAEARQYLMQVPEAADAAA